MSPDFEDALRDLIDRYREHHGNTVSDILDALNLVKLALEEEEGAND